MQPKNYKYILLTAARNEEKNIEKTLKSLVNQTVKPLQWIIVSDGSTDNTDKIIQSYLEKNNFIKFFRASGDRYRNFGSKVKAINFAKNQVDIKNYDYIGVLDADISFHPDYFEKLIIRFEKNPKLGIGGGIIYEIYDDKKIKTNISLNSVAGAVQLFRRKCFDELGDFFSLRYGGEDAAMEVKARMNLWETRTFPDLQIMHYGYIGRGSGNMLKAKYKRGIMYYQLGYHPLFQIVKCFYRIADRPYVISSIIELFSFFLCNLRKEKVMLPSKTVKFLRKEQMQRLKNITAPSSRGAHWGESPDAQKIARNLNRMILTNVYRHLALPVVDLARRTDSVKVYRSLKESQWWSESKLKDLQMQRLRDLLTHAAKHVAYYRDVFQECGFDPKRLHSLDDLKPIPLLTKDILRREQKRIMADNADQFQPRPHRSAGTTGQPIIIQMDRMRHSIGWADLYRWWEVAGWQLGDKQYVIAGAALQPRQLSGYRTRLYSKLNRFEDHTAFSLTEAGLDCLLSRLERVRQPIYLRGYASSIHTLARHAASRDWSGRVHAIFTTAETLFPDQRRQIESALHSPVFDQWGCRDGGICAFECENHRGLHLAIENAVVEICRDGVPVPDGETGDVVATDLFSYAMPIIRYKVGDVASYDTSACSCGRGLPMIREVLGRVSGFILGTGGKRVHGEFFSHVFWETPWVREFQVVQEVPSEVTVKIVLLMQPQDGQIPRIRDTMQRQLGPGCSVHIEIADEIPPGPMGKRQFVICKVQQP